MQQLLEQVRTAGHPHGHAAGLALKAASTDPLDIGPDTPASNLSPGMYKSTYPYVPIYLHVICSVGTA